MLRPMSLVIGWQIAMGKPGKRGFVSSCIQVLTVADIPGSHIPGT